jgi:RNA polymerase sigma-70 factor (ECF subfamily)
VDEAALLRRAREGDEIAFAELYHRHQRPIYRYALRMCGVHAADDVVQDTFVTVLETGDRFDAARGTLGGYLFGIARHLVLKRLGPHYETGLDEAVDHAASPAGDALAALTQQEQVAAVRAAIETLPPAFREAVVLCDLEEFDYISAAQLIGCPIGTIRSRLHRARTLLATRLAALRQRQRS